MRFTGRNLVLVRDALMHAISDIQTDIGSCPAPFEYENEIKALEERKTEFELLLARVELRLDRLETT